MGVNGGLKSTEFGAPGLVTAILGAKNWQKVDKFEPVYFDKDRY